MDILNFLIGIYLRIKNVRLVSAKLIYISTFASSILLTSCFSYSSHRVISKETSSSYNLNATTKLVDEFLNATGVNGGILIAKDGKILLDQGYGYAVESDKTPITSQSIFNIGSVTKQFTAAAVLKLEEQGLLKTTDLIIKYFDDVLDDKKQITIHHLLSNTAGFTHYGTESTTASRKEAIDFILNSKLKFNPGEKFGYSNAGFILLAAIIEIASGRTYEEYLRDNLWLPAGMYQTGNQLPSWNKEQFVQSYDASGDVDPLLANRIDEKGGAPWFTRGAGGILSTLNDLYKWHLALNDTILSRTSKKKMFTPYAPFKAAIGPAHYGYGWAIAKTDRGITVIEHNGGNGYNYTDFYRYIDEGVVMLYFTNERQTRSLRNLDSMPAVLFGKEVPNFPKPKIKLTEKDLARYSGTYQLPLGETFTLDVVNGQLSVKTSNVAVGSLFTTFPLINTSDRSNNLEQKTAHIITHIIKENIDQVSHLLDIEGTSEQENAYWLRTLKLWEERFGAFVKSDVIGTIEQDKYLVTYLSLQFRNGSTIVEFRQNEIGKFFIGHPSFLLPRFYRLIPQNEKEFLVYNQSLQTTTTLVFDNSKKKTHLIIRSEDGDVQANKL